MYQFKLEIAIRESLFNNYYLNKFYKNEFIQALRNVNSFDDLSQIL